MSSDEDGGNDGGQSKKRRVQSLTVPPKSSRACDICRRKKIRCDGVQASGNKCSNCIAYNFDCTYVEAAKKRGPPKAYVEGLENRVEKMERLLRQIMPEEEYMKELGNFVVNRDTWTTARQEFLIPQGSPQSSDPIQGDATEITLRAIRKWDHDPGDIQDTVEVAGDEDLATLEMTESLKKWAIGQGYVRFFGRSSGAMLVQTAINLKEEYTGNHTNLIPIVLGKRRPEFWHPRSWEPRFQNVEFQYTFPDRDLIDDLSELYFRKINVFQPLLHRPTFERNLDEGLHLRDNMFGAVVLLVCANGARFSNDPRVLLDGVDSWLSCGWKWFEQVHLVRNSLLSAPTLHDLQFFCLSSHFLQGSSTPHAAWTIIGTGLRLAQDIGAHRRKLSKTNTVEDELYKRAFWVLISMDRLISASVGRPCAVQDEDFDVDMPVECDDEYWEHPDPDLAFRQPPGKPSTVSSFNALLRLLKLLLIALRTIYSINKSKILLGFVGQHWEQRLVAELDSAMNQWVDSVPEHLRWDPNRENDVFFNLSAVLYTTYYQVQILIHRPFIPSPKKPSPLSFPSLAICTNAARSISHIVDVQRKRKGFLLPSSLTAVFTAGIVLLLNIWGGKRAGLSTDPNKEMGDVHKCMQVLRELEDRWHTSGRLWDVLYELASVGELPLPKASPPSQKRERDADSPISSGPSARGSPVTTPADSVESSGTRSIAGSKRALQSATNPSPDDKKLSHPPQQEKLFPLPIYSDELGRLPLHGQLNYDAHSGLDHAGGYWFSSPEVSQNASDMLPPGTSTNTSLSNGIDLTSNSSSSHDLTMGLPSGYPALADAEFFDQLTSMSWSAGRMGQGGYYGIGDVTGEVSGNHSGLYSQQQRQHQQFTSPGTAQQQHPMSHGPMAMWSAEESQYGVNNLGTYINEMTDPSSSSASLNHDLASQAALLFPNASPSGRS